MELSEARALALEQFASTRNEREAAHARHSKARKEIDGAKSHAEISQMSEDAQSHWQFFADHTQGFASWPFELQKEHVSQHEAPRGPKVLSEYIEAARVLFAYWLSEADGRVITAAPFAETRADVFKASDAVRFLAEEFQRLNSDTGTAHKQHAYTVASRFRGIRHASELAKVI